MKYALPSPPFTRSALAVALLCVLPSTSVVAEGDGTDSAERAVVATQPLQLGPVVVEENELDPAALRLERLEQEQPKSVRDLFNQEANAEVAGGVRAAQRLYLRGIEGSNINITVDGARQGQNLYNHRGGLGNIDPALLKRLDILPGPPRAEDGHGALGGSIRMETADAQDLLAPGEKLAGRLSAGGASADKRRGGSVSAYGLLAEEVGLLAHLSNHEYKDLRPGDGERIPFSGGKDQSYLVKLSLLNAAGHELRLAREQHQASGLNYQQRGDYPWQLQPEDPRARPPRQQQLERVQNTLHYRYHAGSPWLDVELRAYQSDNSWQGMTGGGATERFVSEVRGADLRNTMQYNLASLDARLVVGLDVLAEKGINQVGERPDRLNHYDNLGLFVQQYLESGPGQLWFGVRHDDFEAQFRNKSTQSDGSATSFNLGGAWDLTSSVTGFASYGESARGAGTLPVHFAGNIVDDGALLNGSLTGPLRPEVSRQQEVGLRWQQPIGNGLLRAQLQWFNNRIADAILFDQPGSGGLGGRPVTELYNAERTARFQGTEVRLDYQAGPWLTTLSLMQLDVRDLPEQAQFLARTGAPQGDTAVLRLDYALSESLTLGYGLTAVAGLAKVPEHQAIYMQKPGYVVHDLNVSWYPLTTQPLRLDLAVHNVLDKTYSRHSTLSQNGFSTLEPGRDVRLGLQYRF